MGEWEGDIGRAVSEARTERHGLHVDFWSVSLIASTAVYEIVGRWRQEKVNSVICGHIYLVRRVKKDRRYVCLRVF